MTSLTIRYGTARPRPTQAAHPKATIKVRGGAELVLPFAPNEVTHDGFAGAFAQIARPGRKPLLIRGGEGLRTLGFELLLAYPNRDRSVQPIIDALEAAALAEDPVRVSLSALERGTWQITAMTVSTQARQQGTNAVTRAVVGLTLTEDVRGSVNVGPISGGKKGDGKKGKGGKGKGKPDMAWGPQGDTTTEHVVADGDTVASIALDYYGDPNRWPVIAVASRISDPRRLVPGQRLTIPPAGE